MKEQKKKSLFGKPQENKKTVNVEDARAGRTSGVTRYVLGISLSLVAIAFAILLAIF